MDFTVFGVARSGTTAFAHMLNLHPNVFCAIESILPQKNIEGLVFPDVFFDEKLCGAHAQKNIDKTRGKEIKISGNKFPRYFLYLDELESQKPYMTHHGIYREEFDFVSSWNNRVEAGTNWDQGRTGLIGVLEQIMFIRNVFTGNKSKRYLYSYRKLLQDDSEHFEVVFKNLGVDPNLVKDSFIHNIFDRPVLRKKKREKSKLEKYSEVYLNIGQFDDLVCEFSGRSIEDYSIEANAYLEELLIKLPKYLKEMYSFYSELEKEYILKQRKVFESFFPELNELIKRIENEA